MVTPDGSPVELYTLLQHTGEADIIHAAIRPGGTILELGAGAGRVTHPLIALGHPVTAVDFSDEMLSHITGAEKICADIELLRLNRTFDGVVLGQTLMNTNDDVQRDAFLQTCRAHVSADGIVLCEVHRHTLLDRARPGLLFEDPDGMRVSWLDVERTGEVVSGTLEFRLGERVWTHTFTTRYLDQNAIESALEKNGLRYGSWHEESRWFSATPAQLYAKCT
jgi:SAM-dependent methyltransferase